MLQSFCCLQVVLTVSQIMWCRDLTECLTSEEDVEAAVAEAEQRCFQVHFLINTVVLVIALWRPVWIGC